MADTEYAGSVLSRPTQEPIKWDGKAITPRRLVEIWTTAASDMKPWHDEVTRTEGLRRGTLVRKIAESWSNKHPEAAKAAVVRIPQRRTLESDLKARLSAVEPTFIRNAIGDRETDIKDAQAYEDYLNEWATSEYGIPYTTFLDLGVEVGGYLRVRVPAMADMEGRPDFFERISAKAHAALTAEERATYKKDGNKRRSKPYVKIDENDNPVPAKLYRDQIDNESPDDKKLPPMRRAERKQARTAKAEADHDEAVQRYLLDRPASTAQVYGGLDVAPIFKRGIGREQAVLAAAITRQLVSVEEAIEAGYGWKGMGGRLLVPKGDSETNTVGRNGAYYLYQMFVCIRDEEHDCERPLILYTLGGKGTSVDGADPGDDNAVGVIDLYDEYGLTGPFWSWHTGLKTRDRNPAYRQRPYLSDLVDLVLGIEGQEAAIRGTAQVVSFTGHVEVLGNALRGPNATEVLEATVETGATGKQLKKFVAPQPGETTTSIGEIQPFQQTQIGRDAYQILASDRQALAEAIAVDQAASAPGSSGRAIVVGETLAKVAKKDIRDEALEAWRRDGEDQSRILTAIERLHKIKWPIQKVEPPPSDAGPDAREKYTVAEWDSEWVADGRFTRLKAEYPEEFNLAALDEEAALAERGFSHLGNVLKKKGITDPLQEWQDILEWRMRQNPVYEQKVMLGVAQRRGDRTMEEIIKQLQAQQKLSEAGVPGASNGVPTSATRRAGANANDQRGQTGGPTAAQSARGGEISAEHSTASLNQEGQAQMQVAGSAA
jgi:hypothetical protein